jgi:dienelactone hydrolase
MFRTKSRLPAMMNDCTLLLLSHKEGIKGMRTTFAAVCLAATSLLAGRAAAGAHAPHDVAAASVRDFIRAPDFAQVAISPDGKYLSAVVPVPDKPYQNLLAVLDGKTGKVIQVIRSGRTALISDYFWAADDRLIASMAIKRNGLDTPMPTGELFAIDPDGRHQLNLFGYRARKYNPISRDAHQRYAGATPISRQLLDGRYILIAVNDFSDDRRGTYTYIEKLDIRTGRSVGVGVSPARNALLVADHAGQVRAAYAENTFDRGKLWTRRDNDAQWQLVNDSQASGRTITPIGFNRDNSRLYVRVAERTGPDAIESMDPTNGTLSMVFRGRFADPGTLLHTADRQDYYAVIDRDGKPSLHYIEPESAEARLSRALAKSFPGQLAYFSSYTRDGKHAIVRVSSDRDLGEYYLFDLATANARFLFSAEPWIDPQKMRPMQPVQLQARDGLTLHGFLTLPTGSRPYPLIVLPHGGPHGIADRWGYDPEVQLFATHGYAVLQVNYRGSGGYGAGFQRRGYRQWGLSMQDDLTDATHWAIDQGYATPGHICIYGASYGGYAALEGVVREPDLYRCAIGYAGVYDLRVQLDKSDTRESNMGNSYLDLVLGRDRQALLARSPLAGVSRIKANLLLIHGKSDPRVPFKNFSEFTSALDKAGKPYQSLVEPDEGHGFFTPAHRLAAYATMLDFLDHNIGAQAGSIH